MDFERRLEQYILMADDGLKKYLPNSHGTIAEAMTYSVFAGGKRLRPVIVLASSEAFGGEARNALPFAAALEMIHTYSLIHDDLPAMDNDDYRRGKPSCHKKFGEANAILAGDALLNRAFEIMLQAVKQCAPELTKTFSEAAWIIGDAAGINGMVSGQALDISYENKAIDEETLININKMKTGALISAAFKAGAVIGGAAENEAASFACAGMDVGTAFQIRDDVLDSEGSFEELGKKIGSDEKNCKTTYLTLLGREKCIEKIEQLTTSAIHCLEKTPADIAFLGALIKGLAVRSK